MKNKNILIFDGAFGTYYNKITNSDINCELANIHDKDTVLKIHKEYILAGVNAIKTNTFGANVLLSQDHHLIEQIIKNGLEIANEAAHNTSVEVFADIGNIFSDTGPMEDEYKKITQLFINLGAKNFIFETLSSFEPIKSSLELIKNEVSDYKIIVSFAVKQDGYTKTGHYFKSLFSDTKLSGATYIGVNCICGPSHMLNLIKDLNYDDTKLSVMPNSGYPSEINGRIVYRDNPEYFADKLFQMYLSGASVIGGCCGTTPEHIRAAVKKFRTFNVDNHNPSISTKEKHIIKEQNIKIPALKTDSKTIVAVELAPPVDTNAHYILSAAKQVKDLEADFVTVPDSPLGRTRADSIMLSAKIKREVGIDVIPHLSCRDKNQIAIKGMLLSANIEHINNILVITGDPLAQTERNKDKGVFSFNSYNLISYINNLNKEAFLQSPFNIFGALNINSPNFENELKRAEKKVELGAGCLLTQPIFSQKNIENYLHAKEQLNCKILAGILPVASYNNAMFLNNEVHGIEIPKTFVDLLKNKSPEETKMLSVQFSVETINKIKDNCDGYYIMTPMKKIDFVSEVIKYIKN